MPACPPPPLSPKLQNNKTNPRSVARDLLSTSLHPQRLVSFFVVFSFSGDQCPPKAVVVCRHLRRFHHLALFSFGGFHFSGRMHAKNRDRSPFSVLPKLRPKMVKELTLLRIRCTDPRHTPSDPSSSPQTTPSCEPHPGHYPQRVHHPQASSYSTSPPKHS